MKNDALLLNTKELLKILNVSEKTLRKGVASGIFPEPIRFGGLLRWNKKEIEQLTQNSKQLLTIAQVLRILNVSRYAFLNELKAGNFPKPLDFGGNSKRWKIEDIESFVNRKKIREKYFWQKF